MTTLTRLYARAGRRGACVVLSGATAKGYPVVTINGRQYGAHRLVCEWAWGPAPGGAQALHSCDNSRCVSPAHLRWGTHAENMADKVARGRCRNQYTDAMHCKRGHALSDDNTYVNPASGSRQCRTCRRADNARRRRDNR